MLTLNIGGRPQLALTKTVVTHPIRPYIEHVDLVVISRGEKVGVEVQIVVVGEAGPDTLVTQELNTIEVEADVSSIPEQIEVSVEGLTPRHPDPRLRRRAARRHHAAHGRRDPGRQRRRRADRRAARGVELDTEGAGVVEEPPSARPRPPPRTGRWRRGLGR